MIAKIKAALLIFATMTLMIGTPVIGLASASAATGCSGQTNNINAGVNAAFSNTTAPDCSLQTTGAPQSLAGIAKTVVNIMSLIVGIVAVIMIIYGGLRYITSGGDSNSVGGAKNTLIYAIIGLVIVALAQLIVHFVLNATLNGSVDSSTS
jgi:uncharacterized membrane protein